MWGVFRRLAAFVLLAATCGPVPALAQFALSYPVEPPAQIVRDALVTGYGNALMEEFAKVAARAAEVTCLRDKALDAAQFQERGKDLFQRWGTRSMETLVANVDLKKFDSTLAARAGADAPREIMQLREAPDVQHYLEIERPVRLTKVLDFVTPTV